MVYSKKKTDCGLGVLEHLPGLLIGAFLLQTLPLQISHLQFLKKARVIPPSPDQDAMGPVWIQKDFQTEKKEFNRQNALDVDVVLVMLVVWLYTL